MHVVEVMCLVEQNNPGGSLDLMDLHLGLIDLRFDLVGLVEAVDFVDHANLTSDRPSGQHSPLLAFQALLRWSVGDLVGTKSCSGPTLLELSF